MSMDPEVPDESRMAPAKPTRVDAFALWQQQKVKRDIREEYLARWEATSTVTGTGRPVDAILSPVAPYTATPHGLNK